MRQETRTIYKFPELSEDAKEKALENNHGYNVDFESWHEFTIEQAKEAAKMLGIDIDNIYFSGFSSQGDGACFTGNYEYKKGSLKTVKSEFPEWAELHNVAKQLQDLQKINGFRLEASVSHIGHYYHENCTAIDVFMHSILDGLRTDNIKDDTIENLADILREFMQLIYSSLNREYDYQTSDEAIEIALVSNDIEFLENGEAYS